METMKKTGLTMIALLSGLALSRPGTAHAAKYLTSAGPRVGALYLTDRDTRNKLQDYATQRKEGAKVSPVLTVFGWQFEYEYLNTEGGSTGLIEIVPVVVGLESGLALPSLNTIIGVRFAGGFELGFGPSFSTGVREVVNNAGLPNETRENRTTVGVGMTGVIGTTMRAGKMNFPMNLAAVRNENGYRVSFLFGWTL
jgi:hypothetical protein